MILLRSLKSGLNETNSHRLSTPLVKRVLLSTKFNTALGELEILVPGTNTIAENGPIVLVSYSVVDIVG